MTFGDDLVTTFAGWLAEQFERQDQVGELARLWKGMSPGRVSSVPKVTEMLQAQAERATLPWVPEALAATIEEYRVWKVNPEAASVASPATRSQLDRIEYMLSRIIDALGIPMIEEVVDSPDADVTDIDTGKPVLVPHIGAAGLEMKPSRHPILPDRPYHNLEELEAGVREATGSPDWAKLYSYADHDLPEGTEIGEIAE